MTIGENLRLVRPLARGGMGSVWVAHHLGLQSRVAVKFPDESFRATDGFLARFAREAAAVAKMRSPHVVQILDYGTLEGGVPYIVMELLEGESLGQRISRLERISVPDTASIIQQMCKALTRAHSLGIVHRDIKPDNVYLTDADGDLFVKVLDFGIAKVESVEGAELTSTGTTVGTPSYASPEQLMSAKTATASTDLWAIAATAYRALTGTLPFTGETFAGLCLAITRGEFKRPTEIQPDLPPALDDWFARALDVTPERRFPSARELGEQFVVAAGLAGASLTVHSALPPRAESDPRELQVGPDSGLRAHGETIGLPGIEDLRPARSTAAASPRAGRQGDALGTRAGSGTGVSIGGASISTGEHGERRSVGKMVVIGVATAALVSVAAFVLARSGAPTEGPNQATSGAASLASATGLVAPSPPAAALPPPEKKTIGPSGEPTVAQAEGPSSEPDTAPAPPAPSWLHNNTRPPRPYTSQPAQQPERRPAPRPAASGESAQHPAAKPPTKTEAGF